MPKPNSALGFINGINRRLVLPELSVPGHGGILPGRTFNLGCGVCVAACRNASASLFVEVKITHLALLPQSEAERTERVVRMVAQMDGVRLEKTNSPLADVFAV